MFTKWAKKTLSYNFNSGGMRSIPGFTSVNRSDMMVTTDCKDYSGTDKSIVQAYNISFSHIATELSNVTYGVAFGSGTTPATENDYCLGSIISSGISVTAIPSGSTGVVYKYNQDGTTSGYIDYTITNTGSESITISEIGLFGQSYSGTKGSTAPSGSSNNACVLIDRTLLDNPITIPAGESATVRYEFIFPAISND